MNAIEIDNVTKSFGTHVAVRALSLTVPAGCTYGFIGPNGSGKTTTLRMIMRILHPSSGSIRVLGESTTLAANDRVGYLPEERGLYKTMTVRAGLRFFAALKGSRDRQAIDDWLERLGLADWAEKKIETLSKGMAQKVQFIAAVAAQPDLLLLDEPFSGLDPVNLEVLREAVLEQRRRGATVVFSTHDMSMAEKMCDYVFMIYQGNKVLDGTLEDIRNRHGTDVIRVRLQGDTNGLRDLPGVLGVTDLGRFQDLRVQPGFDTQPLLAALMQRGTVEHFELARPSLHDIFVHIAGPREGEGNEPNVAE
ncbi:MAG: ABC transporter ATP-binding protein [Gemmataceae bacterium]